MSWISKSNAYFWKFIYAISIVISIILFINAVIIPGQVQNATEQLLSIPTILFSSIVFLIFSSFLMKSMNNKKVAIIIYTAGVVLQIVFQIYLAVKMQGAQGVDDFDMYLQAGYLSKNFAADWAPYFKWAPQNMAATFIFAVVIRLCGVFSSIPVSFFVNIFSFICIDIAILCGFLIVRKYNKNSKVAHAYFIMSILFMPLYILPLIMYTDVMSVMLLSLGMLALYNIDDKKKIYTKMFLFLCSAICFTFASIIKMNSLIAIIALVLFIVFNEDYNLKRKILYLLCMVPIFFIFSMQGKVQDKSIDMHSSGRFPYSYWVGVGFNSQTDGTVYKDGIDTWWGTNVYKTYSAKDKHNKKIIKKSIDKLGLLGLLNLWERKINVQWSLGGMGINNRGYQITRNYHKTYSYIYGDQRAVVLTISQIIYIVMLLGYIVYSFKTWENGALSIKDNFMFLFVIGVVCFHTFIWEVQARYSFLVVIALLILGSVGLSIFSDEIINVSQKASRKMVVLPVICILGLIVGYTLDYSKTVPIDYDMPVVSQMFFRTKPIELKSNSELSEKIVIPKNFTKITVSLGDELKNNNKISMFLESKTGERVILNSDTTDNLNMPNGEYKLVLRNNSDNTIQVPVLKSALDLGILQSPISKTTDAYFNFSVMDSKKIGILSRLNLNIMFILNIILIYISYIMFRKISTP